MSGHSLHITVGKSKQIVAGIHRDTRVEDIVEWLCQRNALSGQHVLVEVWRGCSRLLDPKEKLSESFSSWGAEGRHVTLLLEDCKRFYRSNYKTGKKRKRKRAGTTARGVKIFSKHSPRSIKYSSETLIKRRLRIKINRLIADLKELQIQMKDEEINVMDRKNEAEMVSFLNPFLQGKYISSRSSVSKAKQMKKDLEKHRKELEQIISNRQSEILSLETNVEGTQEKIEIERSVLERAPSNLHDNEDYKQATQKLEDLQNRLRAKQKISQLQSSKMQELLTEKNKVEKLIQTCKEEISTLRSQMYKSREEEEGEMV